MYKGMTEKYSSESSSEEEQSFNNSIPDFPKFSTSSKLMIIYLCIFNVMLKIIFVLTDTTGLQNFFEKVIGSDAVIELNKSLGDDCMEVSMEHQEIIS